MLLRSSLGEAASRWEQHKHGSRSKLFKGSLEQDSRCRISLRQPRRCMSQQEEKEAMKLRGQPVPVNVSKGGGVNRG